MATFGQQLGGVPRKGMNRALKQFFDYADYIIGGVSQLGTKQTITGMQTYEHGFNRFRSTHFRFDACAVPLTYSAGVVSYKGTKLYQFPKGNILFLGATAKLATTKSSAGLTATWAGLFGLGTVTAAADATLTSTEQNVIPSTVIAAAVAGVGAIGAQNAAAIAPLDNDADTLSLYANILANTADTTATAVNVGLTGDVWVHWMNLGKKS